MAPEAPYLAELKATERPILRRHCLQRASNDLPPGALTRLYMQLPALGGRALCKMAPEFRYMTARARRRAAKQPDLVKQPEHGPHAHYITPDTPSAQKTLYIIFSGQDGQFFIPFAALLSLLPKGPKDVVAVRADIGAYFLGKIDGLGNGPYEVSRRLREKFKTDDFERVVVMGLSAGGVFSLRVAAFLPVDVCVCFAAIYLNEGFRVKSAAAAGVPAFDPVCACHPGRGKRMINVVATKNEYDVLSSKRLKKLRPSLREVHLVNGVEHNVLRPMLKTGMAGVFFRMALARNGAMLWLTATLTRAYGLILVRGIRQVFGLQKIQNWYFVYQSGTDAE